MTISARNRILSFFTLLTLVTLLYILWVYMQFLSGTSLPDTDAFLFLSVRSGTLLLTALVSLLGFFRYFQKVTGILIFFYFISLSTMIFEATPILGYIAFLQDAPMEQLVMLSRIRLFGMSLGAFAFFTTSVYISGINYQNQGTVFLVLIGISFIIAQITPLATANPGISRLFPPTLSTELGILYGVIILLTFLNFLKSSLSNQNLDELVIGFSMVTIMLGRWFVNTSGNWVGLGLGTFFMILGIVIYGKRVFAVYLWY